MTFTLHSSAFSNGSPIPKQHTEDGADHSPPLAWSGQPANTKELALVVDDPDAPTAEPWVHWILCNIPASLSALLEGFHGPQVPAGQASLVQGANTWGGLGYRGPAPPRGHGTHHYHFKLYALDAPLGLLAGFDKKKLLACIKGHVLAEAELVGTYERR